MIAQALRRTLAPAALVAAVILAAGTTPAGAAPPALRTASFGKYHHVLVDASGHALYLLTSEGGGKIHCVKSCLVVWPALMLPVNVGEASHSVSVKGSLGYVRRGKFRQATFNGYPLYLYVGDRAAKQARGVGLTTGTGTWLLVNGEATTAAATPVRPAKTASAGSGGGW